MNQTAEAIKIIDPAVHVVRRVNLPDLSEKGQWLTERLREKFPGFQDAAIMNYLKSLTLEDNSRTFVRTDRAFGMFEVSMDKMLMKPTILDRFVKIEEGADVSEGQALYDHAARWAKGMGASEILIDPKSDVLKEYLKERFEKVVERTQLIAKVGK